MDARVRKARQEWQRWVREVRSAMGRAARHLSRRLVLVCTVVVLVTLVVPASGLGAAWGIPAALAKGPKPNHSPTTYSSFQRAADAAKKQQKTAKPVFGSVPGPSSPTGLKPGNAPR